MGQGGKSVLLCILVDCKIQVFLAFLSVLQNSPIKARVWYFVGGIDKILKNLNEQAACKDCGTDRISYTIRGDSL